MLKFKHIQKPKGLLLIKPQCFKDKRGWFMDFFKSSEFKKIGIPAQFDQHSLSKSRSKNVIRGLHFQSKPYEQGKLVHCISGKIFDVSVDIRTNSPTYKKWYGVILSSENNLILWIPPGFAHGFCTLTENSAIYYKMTAEYNPKFEKTINWMDPTLKIKWPTKKPIISKKDKQAPFLKDIKNKKNI